MDKQVKTAMAPTRPARIEAAREGLRSALVRLAKAKTRIHGAASPADGAGRGTEAGHCAPSGQ